MRSIPSYIKRSIITIVRIFAIYRPFRFFGTIGIFFFFCGVLLGARFLAYLLLGHGDGHIQSLILSSVLMLRKL